MSVAMPPSDGRPFEGAVPALRAPAPGTRGTGVDPRPGQRPALPLNRFLSELGHELVMPMNRMMSMARLLLQAELPRDQQRIAHEICQSGDSLLRLVNDALDYAGAQEGERKPATIAFDLRHLVEETMERLRARSGQKRVTVEARVHHEVPSRVIGDAGRVRQVLWNLAVHALDALPAGGLALRVGRLQETSDCVTIRFDWRWYHATEMGGAPAEPEPPRAGEATGAPEPAPRGSELHLAIARCLAGLIGGEIALEGEPGSPARAWFDLTLGKQAELSQDEITVVPRESLAGARVLVADPRDAMRSATAATLKAWGCRTLESASAEDARARLIEASAAGDPFRFVLIEQELAYAGDDGGSLSGAGATGAVTHFVVLAAVGRRGDLDRARKRGFSAYLPAPIDWQELADALIEIERLAATTPAGAERPLVTRHWMAEMRRSRTRVLVVEDDVVSALVTDWTLRRIGYQVVRLRTAAELRTLAPAALSSFDLAILALRLPDADGLSLVGELRAPAPEGHSTAIVAIGYEGTRLERERCHAAGVDAYIPSPVDLAHLCELVEQITRTDLSYGPEREDLVSRSSLTVRERAEALGMVLFRYHVDPPSAGPEPKPALPAPDRASESAEPRPAVPVPYHPSESPVPKSAVVAPEPDPAELSGYTMPPAEPVPLAHTPEPEPLLAPEAEPARAVGIDPAPDHAPAAQLDLEPLDKAPPQPDPRPAETVAAPALAALEAEAAGRAHERPVLDVERLDQTSLGNAAVKAHLLGSFVNQMRTGLVRLAQAIASSDAGRVRSEIDRMAQVAGMVGATRCASVLAAMQHFGPGRPLVELSPLIADASREVDRFERATSLMDAAPPGPPSMAA